MDIQAFLLIIFLDEVTKYDDGAKYSVYVGTNAKAL
jgi:hypothetical protein